MFKNWDELQFTDEGNIQVYMDHTDLQIDTYIQRRLYDIYHIFIESLVTDCDKAKKVGNVPIVFETFHGSLSDELRKTFVPGLMIA